MKKILALSLILISLHAPAETKVDLELDVFGLSYHTNRDYDFNERNPGLGLDVVFSSKKSSEDFWRASMVLSGGVYKDSFSERAEYLFAGPRLTMGYDDSLHAMISVQGGYLDGSGTNGLSAFPVVGFGYDWFNVCFTGIFTGSDRTEMTSATTGVVYSRMVAVFLKFRVLDF